MKEIYPELGGLMMRITRTYHKINQGAISGMGIHPSEHFLLMCLVRMGSAVSQIQIAERMDVTPASVARTIKNLDAGGYIERNECEGDGRRNEIRITEKGRTVAEETKRLFMATDEEIYAGFSDEELECLRGLLSRMLDNASKFEQNRKAREEMEEK